MFPKVGGCLAEHWEVWESWGADAWVVQVLCYGYRVPFRSWPPLSHVPTPFPATAPIPSRGWLCRMRCLPWWRRRPSRSRLLHLGFTVASLSPPKSPGVGDRSSISHASTVGSSCPASAWRLLSPFSNLSVWGIGWYPWTFRMLPPGSGSSSLSPLPEVLRGGCGISISGPVLLSFFAPRVFIHVMAPVSSIMHRHGFRLFRYLDDWLVPCSIFQKLVRARDFLLWLCHLLGIIVNPSKSSLVPTQTRDYLGMT